MAEAQACLGARRHVAATPWLRERHRRARHVALRALPRPLLAPPAMDDRCTAREIVIDLGVPDDRRRAADEPVGISEQTFPRLAPDVHQQTRRARGASGLRPPRGGRGTTHAAPHSTNAPARRHRVASGTARSLRRKCRAAANAATRAEKACGAPSAQLPTRHRRPCRRKAREGTQAWRTAATAQTRGAGRSLASGRTAH
mmetsp:Transcript_32165/g.102531  ORF Transcript_32165/g.102531 Transcript_32165/m.102531 type:complete len:200 (+) Transcript_32165:142-741(+)